MPAKNEEEKPKDGTGGSRARIMGARIKAYILSSLHDIRENIRMMVREAIGTPEGLLWTCLFLFLLLVAIFTEDLCRLITEELLKMHHMLNEYSSKVLPLSFSLAG